MSSETPVRPVLEAMEAAMADDARWLRSFVKANTGTTGPEWGLRMRAEKHEETVLALIAYAWALEKEVQRVRFSQEKERVPFPLAEQEGLCPDRQAGDQGRPEEGGRGHG